MPAPKDIQARAKKQLALGIKNMRREDAANRLYPVTKRQRPGYAPQPPQPDTRPAVMQMEEMADEWYNKVYPTQFADPAIHDRFVNKVAGPNGEELPYSAIGWGPDGTPLWNIENPTVNAWQRFWYNTFEKPVQVSLNTPEGEQRPWWDTIEATTQGNAPEIKPGQQAPTLATKLVRGPGETLKAVGDMFNDLFEEPFLRGPIALFQNHLENVAAYSDMPSTADYTQRNADLEARIAGMPEWIQNIARWAEKSRQGTIGAAADYALTRTYDALIDGKLSIADLPDIIQKDISPEAFLSGQIMGTIALDAAAQKVFMDRVKAGENPELVWREMQNPWAELAVSLAAPGPGDIPLLGKAWKIVTKWARVPKIQSMSEAVQATRLSPDIEKGLAAIPQINTDPQAGRVLENLRDVATAAVRKVMGATDEAAATPTVRRGAIPILPAIGPNAPTAGHQVNATARVVGRTLRAIIQSQNPNSIVESVNALYKIGSGNADEVFEAMSYVSRNPAARALLSDDGIRTAVMVRRMIGEDPAKFMKAIKTSADKGFTELTEFMNTRMSEAIKDMYPTVTKRIADWEDAVKAATKAGTPPPPPPLPTWRIALDKVHQGAQKTVYGWAASFMNNVFLRFSPAFGVRNYGQGLVHGIFDFGVGSVLRTAKQAQAGIEAYGVPYKGAGLGGGSLGLVGGEKVQGWLDFLGPLNFTRWGEAGEESLAWKVGLASITDSMEKMLQKGVAIPKTDTLIAAGLNEEAAEALVSLVKLNKGNVKKAMKAFEQMYKRGEVDLVLSGQWLTFDEIEKLRKALPESADEILTGIADVRRRGGTVDEAAKILEDAKANYAASTRRLTPVPPEPDDPDFESIGRTLDTAPLFGGEIDGTDILKMNYYGRINVAVKDAYTKLFDDVAVGWRNPNFDSYLRNFFTNAKVATNNVIARINDFQAQLRNVIDRMDRTDFNIGDEWIKLPWPDGSNRINDIPKTKAEFRNKLWEELWYPVTKQLWQNEREAYIRTAETFIDQHAASIRKLPQYDRAQKWHALSKLWDAALVPQMFRRDLQLAIEAGDNARAARILGNAFGISTATEAGVSYGKRDNLLKIINDNLRPGWPKYKSLDEIPADETMYALQNRWYKEAGLATAYGPAGLIRHDPSMYNKFADLTAENLKAAPEPIRNRFQARAKELYSQLTSAQPGGRVVGEGGEVTSYPTSNPQWYTEAYNQGMTDKNRFLKALEYMLNPTGRPPKNKEWKYLIDMIGKDLYNGYFDPSGLPVPPTLQAILHAGDEWGALEGWNDYAIALRKIGETEESIENALRVTAGEFYNRFKEVQRMAEAGVEPRVVNANKVEEVVSQMMGHPSRGAAEATKSAARNVVTEAPKVTDDANTIAEVDYPPPLPTPYTSLADIEFKKTIQYTGLSRHMGLTEDIFGNQFVYIDVPTGRELETTGSIDFDIAKKKYVVQFESVSSPNKTVAYFDDQQEAISYADSVVEYIILDGGEFRPAAITTIKGGTVMDSGAPYNIDERVIAPPPLPRADSATHTPTPNEAAVETLPDIEAALNRTSMRLKQSWGIAKPVYQVGGDTEKISAALKTWGDEAEGLVSIARNSAARVADKAREFNLLNYGDEYGFDLIAKYIFPYQFWYSRSYMNWFKRIAANPKIIGNYKRYRDSVSAEHAGMPEWWKYNVTLRDTGKMLGMDIDNPLYFNLESLLNPLNGMTGVDFDDPEKRVDWFTGFMDDANKLGPSVHPLITLALATSLAANGESEAAARWGGRIIPQTAFLKNALSLMNVNIPTQQGVNEFDPAVNIFSKGQDPYEQRRVARELGIMQMEGYPGADQASVLEEAWTPEKGELWRTATERAIKRRADSPLAFIANLVGGVGLKARNQEDMMIDLFDAEWRRLWASKDILSPQEFQYALDNLRYKYPWGDTVILARKSGIIRDRAYAYNVLGRIPPGQSTELLDLVDLTQEEIQLFYENKGDLTKMNDLDKDKFMTAVVNLGAVIDLPDYATKLEWTEVKNKYQAISTKMEQYFGKDIHALIGLYFSNNLGTDEKNALLEKYPRIGEALDYRTMRIMQDQQMLPYYTSVNNAERYYQSLMWDEINTKYPNIQQEWKEYDDAKLLGTKEAKAYKAAHPSLDSYLEIMNRWNKNMAAWMVKFSEKLASVNPTPRPVMPQSVPQQRVLDYLSQAPDAGPYGMSVEELFSDMSPALKNLVLDYIYNGEELSYAAEQQIDKIADDFGLDRLTYLELLRQLSTQGTQP